jgi:zinc protease
MSFRNFILLASLLLWRAPVFAVPPDLPPFPKLQFQPPKPDRIVLDNGLVIFILEDHELPLIKVDLMYPGGTQVDPTGKTGLGSLFGEAMTYGGSASHTPESIEKLLDRKAASIAFSISLESGSGSMSCRKEDFDEIFGVFQDLVLRPQFRKDKIEVAKAKALEALRRMNDDPDTVARREFRRLMYGASHPYARIPSPATLKNIKREDLLAAHQRFFRPNATWVAVSGDFSRASMQEKIKTAFAEWPKSDVSWPVVASTEPIKARRVYYIQRPINQSQIRMGNIGFARHSPDHFAWEVFNELWGGSAGSQLFRKVRTEQGLAYSVGSGYSEPAQNGLIVAISQTRGSQTMAAIQSMLSITKEARRAPFSDADISSAKNAIQNRFIENFTSSAQIASYQMNLEMFGYPKNYLETYTAHIGRVQRADLERVGKTYLHPDHFAILVMGDLSTFDKPISTLGQAQELKLPDYSQEE